MTEYLVVVTPNELTVWKRKEGTYFLSAFLSEISERDIMLKSYLLYYLGTNSLAKSFSAVQGIRVFDIEEELGKIIVELIKLRSHFLNAIEITSFLKDIEFFTCMEKKDFSTLSKNLSTYKTFLRIEGKEDEGVQFL